MRRSGFLGLHVHVVEHRENVDRPEGLPRVNGVAFNLRVRARRMRETVDRTGSRRARKKREKPSAPTHGRESTERGLHRHANKSRGRHQRPGRGRPDAVALGHFREDVERMPGRRHVARLPGEGQRAGSLRFHAIAYRGAQRGAGMRRIAVGQRR